MKITKIETFTAQDQIITIVKITTEDGSIGFGQLPTYFSDVSTYVLHRQVAKCFIGKDICRIKQLEMEAIEANHKFIGSHICRAVAGIETAALDLLAKADNKSVAEFLGGQLKDIKVYGSSMRRDISPEAEAQRLIKLKEEGMQAFKVRIGSEFGHNKDAWEGRTETIIPTVRKAIGYELDLLADANSCYTPDKAIEVGKMLEQYKIFHYEEPCPHMELGWTRQVTQALSMDIAGGEQDNVLGTWRAMVDMGVVNIVQPDVLYGGGMYRAMEVAAMAKAKGMVCTPHAANHSLVTLFTAHFLCAIDNGGSYMEYSIEEYPWVKDLYQPFLQVKDGKVRLSGEPGWGVQIKKEWMEKTTHKETCL